MMILRNGIRSALRARGRTVLFFSLILLLCAVLTLALGMWSYSARTLSDMDDNYTSVALIEYMGENYPAADMADADARDAAAALNDDSIFKIPGIRLWERTDQTFAAMDWHYWFATDMPYFTAAQTDQRNTWISDQPRLIALNDLSAAPDFYYGSSPEIQWLDGWDEGFLAESGQTSVLDSIYYYYNDPPVMQWQTYPCLVSQSFLESHGLSLGDCFDISTRLSNISDDEKAIVSLTFSIVGAYAGSEHAEEIYVPLYFWCDPEWITGKSAPLAQGERPTADFVSHAERDAYFYSISTFTTCRFTLNSARYLDSFKSYLAQNQISQAGVQNQNRTTVIIRDEAFMETAGSLERYMAFGQILLPPLCAAVGLLGFIISWLMVNGRKLELAMMRGLGAPRSRVFFSFFLEQGILAAAGAIAAGLILTLTGRTGFGWLGAAVFLAFYLSGCALAVTAVCRTRLLRSLSEPE